ncbi:MULTISPECIES: DUF4433 domain-containing protein [unclassified Plantibacter]|uniref:DUF4433 domain-containing protein n=1 Tax=unclassified Plantibacter TaxID=2624265 RepID=UPI0009ECA4D2|nr:MULTISPECIES: DUF4433 domain-containing protein [unclassified Plantibacter]
MMKHFPQSGFFGLDEGPTRSNPEDWYVWHFTRVENLASIASEGSVLSDESKTQHLSVANADVKERRRTRLVTAPGYPEGRTVSSHVPWYFATKSPMLYVVQKNSSDNGDGLIFLGMRIGDLVESGLSWCASDANAAAALTQFSTDLGTLGDFVDFGLLCQQMWNNTPDDPDRKSRRAAEVLVYDRVPLELVTVVIAQTQPRVSEAKTILGTQQNRDFRASMAPFF